MKVLSLFDGKSGGMLALKQLGFKDVIYHASEIDKYAIAVSKYHYPNIKRLGDVTKIQVKEHYDLIIGGSPCQSFSNAGNKEGFKGKSGLFWEFVRILKEAKKINPNIKFILENVKMKNEWQDIISKALEVEPIEINSSLVSAQNRRRLYWTNIKGVTMPKDRNIMFSEILEEKYDSKYNLSEKAIAKIIKSKFSAEFLTKDTKKVRCLIAGYYKIPSDGNYIKVSDKIKRKLTITEFEKLQTLPDNYTKYGINEKNEKFELSNSQRYKMIGNGWTNEIIKHILENLK